MVVEDPLRSSADRHIAPDTDDGIHFSAHDAGYLNHRGTNATVSPHYQHSIPSTELEGAERLHGRQARERQSRGLSERDPTRSRGEAVGPDSHVLRSSSRTAGRPHPQVAPDSAPRHRSPDLIPDRVHEPGEIHARTFREPHPVEQAHLPPPGQKVDGVDAEGGNLDNDLLGAGTRDLCRPHLEYLRSTIGAEPHRPASRSVRP